MNDEENRNGYVLVVYTPNNKDFSYILYDDNDVKKII